MKNKLKFDAAGRRGFLLSGAGMTAAAMTSVSAAIGAELATAATSLVRPGDRILFQGDSITDAGRDRNESIEFNQQSALGTGYAWMAASQLLVSRPKDQLQCINRGISGNKVYQLAERWQEDCLDIRPNMLSILIGVNDIWHKFNGNYDGTVEIYEKDYHTLLTRTKAHLPNVKLVVCEPFVLKCGVISEKWFPEFDDFRAAARRVAMNANAVFVAFQDVFDRAVHYAPPEHWAKDGVHPTSFGAALMAHAWLQAVGA